MAEETGDEAFVSGFRIAYAHHLNFYTDAMEPDDMDIDRPIVRRLVEKVLDARDTTPGNLPSSSRH